MAWFYKNGRSCFQVQHLSPCQLSALLCCRLLWLDSQYWSGYFRMACGLRSRSTRDSPLLWCHFCFLGSLQSYMAWKEAANGAYNIFSGYFWTLKWLRIIIQASLMGLQGTGLQRCLWFTQWIIRLWRGGVGQSGGKKKNEAGKYESATKHLYLDKEENGL